MLRLLSLIAGLAASVVALTPAWAEGVGCSAFKTAMLRDSGDLKAEFVRPLVVSRGGGSNLESYDLVTRARIDGVLRCQGEVFAAFEARIAMPADAELLAHFARVQQAAAMALLGWSTSRAQRRIQRYDLDASEYLRASAERGDVAVAGKVEEHLPGAIDLGLIWTHSDRTFILLSNP